MEITQDNHIQLNTTWQSGKNEALRSCTSMIEHLLGIHKALGSISSTAKKVSSNKE